MHQFRVYFSRVIQEELLCQAIEAESLQDAIDQTLDYRARELSTLSSNARVTEANVTQVEYAGMPVDLSSVTTTKALQVRQEVRDDSQALKDLGPHDAGGLERQHRGSGAREIVLKQ